MDRKQLQNAVLAITIGAGITLISNILQLLINFLMDYKDNLIPAVTGMTYFLKSWKHTV